MRETIKTQIKICGMTSVQDVESAVELGVDAIGMILKADSPRYIDLKRAACIRSAVPDGILLVGVFVDATAEYIETAIASAGLDLVQLHGDESDGFGAALSVPFIKAIRVKNEVQLDAALDSYPSACALLLDPYVKGQPGGTGCLLDLNLWPMQHHQKLILAGGLSPENLNGAVDATRPYAVDLNSGVENSPGIKCKNKIESVVKLLGRSTKIMDDKSL